MTTLKFTLTPSLPATPYVSAVLQGGKTVSIAFPQGKTASIFVQQSSDGTKWLSKQSISPTNKATFNIFATDKTYIRILTSTRPLASSYEDLSIGGGTVKSVNGEQPDKDGNIYLASLPSAQFATDSQVDALWNN